MHRTAGELREELTDAPRLVVATVELAGDPHRCPARLVHDGVKGGSSRDRPAGVELGDEYVDVHGSTVAGVW
ncbi:hypothetical protein [Janibacter limosus]|uniref:hypothetical protein n=1 Tax=Janibacter limosus TaxID=53458 RepID=UPI0035E0946C